ANCLHQCLGPRFRGVADLKLTDYKVRVLDPQRGTEARVRALIGWSGRGEPFTTAGVSTDVVQASWLALVDAFRLEIIRSAAPAEHAEVNAEYGWGV
ncbi:MAG TPA: alpha-isopropylmalate synthase regulatory domain-containing protein, partial [Bryobacteraceae bacterium]|nr:alpha-isopropylmalate synthase regulatory domain-containing protein [Bryobacteraceae bacterium]